MAKVSIIIVSYNVKKFLQLCLDSIAKSNTPAEVIIVDNASEDGTATMIASDFPDIKYIQQDNNLGFGKACNVGLAYATSPYILFLNPDTVIQEDTLGKCLEYYQSADNPGFLGVKMIDGAGHFLPESKRGIPDMMSSFWKMSGVSSIFPTSRFFNKYYLGHLPDDQSASVDILCGAFMFSHRNVLDRVGAFDEDFFMYGEDIDLSYRALQAGYSNYYLADTSIIHYKGQSTRKEDISYVRHFYTAMSLFTKKHSVSGNGTLQLLLIGTAIQLRKLVSFIKRIVQAAFMPAVEGVFLFLGYNEIQKLWAGYRFGSSDYYDGSPIVIQMGVYSLIWVIVFAWYQMYQRKLRYNRPFTFLGVIIGLVIILLGYSLLPENMRTSRALIFLFGIWTCLLSLTLRSLFLLFTGVRSSEKRIGFIGSQSQYILFKKIIDSNKERAIYSKQIEPEGLNNLDDYKHIYNLNEVVFSFTDLGLNDILRTMTKEQNLEFKIFGNDGLSAIGSRAKSIPGETYSQHIDYTIMDQRNKVLKRVFDVTCSILILLSSPILAMFTRSSLVHLVHKSFRTFIGKMSVVGYQTEDKYLYVLPELQPGMITTCTATEESMVHTFNTDYAMYYSLSSDIKLLLTQWKNI